MTKYDIMLHFSKEKKALNFALKYDFFHSVFLPTQSICRPLEFSPNLIAFPRSITFVGRLHVLDIARDLRNFTLQAVL